MRFAITKKIDYFLSSRSTSKEERIRLSVFLLGTFTAILGFPLHLLRLWGSPNHVLLSISGANWVCIVLILAFFYHKKLSIIRAFSWYGVIMQAFLTAKIIFISASMPPDANVLVLFNSFISMIVIQTLVMGYMVGMPFYLTLASLLTSVASLLIRPSLLQLQIVLLFLFVELMSCALGLLSWQTMHEVEKENLDYKAEEYDLLRILNITKPELLAMLAMSANDNPTSAGVSNIFDHLDERAEHNLMEAVKMRENELRMENVKIASAFPSLSATEQEVCRLVLHGKTLKEIANLLGKTPNNVSAVRIHIRKKLGLETGEDLREYLIRVAASSKTQ